MTIEIIRVTARLHKRTGYKFVQDLLQFLASQFG